MLLELKIVNFISFHNSFTFTFILLYFEGLEVSMTLYVTVTSCDLGGTNHMTHRISWKNLEKIMSYNRVHIC